MNSLNTRVATLIRAQAGAKGYSTNSLADAADLPVSSVRRYFWTGEAGIPMDALAAIAAVFGWSLSELLRRAEETEPEPFVVARPRAGKATVRGMSDQKTKAKVKGPHTPVDR